MYNRLGSGGGGVICGAGAAGGADVRGLRPQVAAEAAVGEDVGELAAAGGDALGVEAAGGGDTWGAEATSG